MSTALVSPGHFYVAAGGAQAVPDRVVSTGFGGVEVRLVRQVARFMDLCGSGLGHGFGVSGV